MRCCRLEGCRFSVIAVTELLGVLPAVTPAWARWGCPTNGDCFSQGTTGCNIPECCAAVCAADPFCCDVFWDGICITEAFTICASCGGAGAGSCYTADGTPACNDAACCNMVCAVDPSCCDVYWDQSCAEQAITLCLGGCQAWSAGPFFETPGVEGLVVRATVWDPDGPEGPSPFVLAVGGDRPAYSNVGFVALWDGFSWQELPT